jgi:D-amino-acid dehydrogenase
MTDVVVLGAGVVGISTALSLRERGWNVTLIDRKGFGGETSFGNAGIIQADTVEPYPMPRSLGALAAIATGRSNDTCYRLSELPQHAIGIGIYWWRSAPHRHRKLSRVYADLVGTSRAEHQRWITAANAEHLIRREGYRVLYRTSRDLEFGAKEAERLGRDYGVQHRLLSPTGLAIAEPSLRIDAAGALHWLSSWTVSDPGALMNAYGETFLRRGGKFHRAEVRTLKPFAAKWTVETSAGQVSTDHVVVALGPWSPGLIKHLGGSVRMLYKRGYYAQFAGGQSLDLPLVDAGNGYVLAPMKGGLRLTTGVHIAALDAPPSPVQLARAELAARDLLDLGLRSEGAPWMGTRPFMPDMLPVIGQAKRHANLWVNFGHGHQGLTLGPSSGRLLAELMSGEAPFVEAHPFEPSRLGL